MFEADRIRITTPLPKWRKWMAAAVLAMGFTGLYHTVSAQQMPKDTIHKDSAATDLNEVFGGIEFSAEFPGGIEKLLKFVSDNLIPDTSCHAGQKHSLCFM